jgi:hypothetical protein
MATEFLKDVCHLRNKVQCNICGRDMTWSADSNLPEGFRWPCERRFAGVRCNLHTLVCCAANQGMYSFRFTLLINTNNTSNYQSTNETHYEKENTTRTTHNRLQLLILTETHYQLQQNDKELHTKTYTTKNHKFTLTLTPVSLQNEMTNVVINIMVASS